MKYFSERVILAGCSYNLTHVDKQFCFRGDDGMNTDYFTLEYDRYGPLQMVENSTPVNASHISSAAKWIEENISLKYDEGVVVGMERCTTKVD